MAEVFTSLVCFAENAKYSRYHAIPWELWCKQEKPCMNVKCKMEKSILEKTLSSNWWGYSKPQALGGVGGSHSYGTKSPKYRGCTSWSFWTRCQGLVRMQKVFVLLCFVGKVEEMQSNIVKEILIYNSDYLIGKGNHLWLIFLEWPKVFIYWPNIAVQ